MPICNQQEFSPTCDELSDLEPWEQVSLEQTELDPDLLRVGHTMRREDRFLGSIVHVGLGAGDSDFVVQNFCQFLCFEPIGWKDVCSHEGMGLQLMRARLAQFPGDQEFLT